MHIRDKYYGRTAICFMFTAIPLVCLYIWASVQPGWDREAFAVILRKIWVWSIVILFVLMYCTKTLKVSGDKFDGAGGLFLCIFIAPFALLTILAFGLSTKIFPIREE